MAVKAKTLVNDVGSAALEEVAAQLNTALSTCVCPLYQMAGTASAGTSDLSVDGGGEAAAGIIFRAHEDMLVVGIDIMVSCASDAATGLVLDVLNSDELTAAAPDPGTNKLIFASDGTGPIWAASTLKSLADITAVDSGNGTDADAFTSATGAHAAVAATNFSAFALTAGQSIRAIVAELSEDPATVVFYVHYRPVKDSLTLSPSFKQAARNFKSTDR